ncbi:MAG: sensor domain-containing protein, partial [Cryobacterium sp.]
MTNNTLDEAASDRGPHTDPSTPATDERAAGNTGQPNSGTLGFVQSADPRNLPSAGDGGYDAPRGYRALWASLPRELGFLLPTLLVVTAAFIVLVTLFTTGLGLVALFVGLFIVVAALYTARGFGVVELTRLRWAGQPVITPPRWTPRGEPASALRAVLGPLVSGHYWLYLLHGMVVNFIVGIVTWSLTIVWVSGALGGLTYWIWSWSLPQDNDSVGLYGLITGSFRADNLAAENLLNVVLGLAFLLTLPFLTRGLVLIHQA